MKKRKLKAIVLAGGQSSRMKSKEPKPLIDLWGQPVIGYVLDALKGVHAEDVAVVINASPEGQRIKSYVEARGAVTFVQEESLGTAHAVLSAEKFLADEEADFLILYADTPLIQVSDLSYLINAESRYLSKWSGAFLAMGIQEKNHSFGVLKLTPNNEIISIVEASERGKQENCLEKEDICNSGICLLSGKYVVNFLRKIKRNNIKKEYFLTDYPLIAREQGTICTAILATHYQSCLGINTAGEFAQAANIMQKKWRQYFLNQGVRLFAPETVFFSYDTDISPGAIIEPNVIIGPKTRIESGVLIRAFSYIQGAQIEKKSTIGPYAHIRPGTVIEEGVKVGNFVEIKKSYLAQGVKASHLSYIGDTTIGKNTNIGAGTITCNYDGINKHKTQIGESAFIGSNTAIVAPVKIGKGALIGAGSTITKDVKENALALTRSAQKSIDDFKKKEGQ